jgi:hypothetical protein
MPGELDGIDLREHQSAKAHGFSPYFVARPAGILR